jgi:hypothetical protein
MTLLAPACSGGFFGLCGTFFGRLLLHAGFDSLLGIRGAGGGLLGGCALSEGDGGRILLCHMTVGSITHSFVLDKQPTDR